MALTIAPIKKKFITLGGYRSPECSRINDTFACLCDSSQISPSEIEYLTIQVLYVNASDNGAKILFGLIIGNRLNCGHFCRNVVLALNHSLEICGNFWMKKI
jgi:hypothetical protein